MSTNPNPPTPAPAPAPAANKWQLFIEIAEIALGVVKGAVPGLGVGLGVAEAAIQIAQKAQAAYALHVGQPMDPSLIKLESPIE